MPTLAADILKKLSYIETEIEIQKQILHSHPSKDRTEIEKTLIKIAEAKKEISALRDQLQEVSPEEYRKLLNIEKGVSDFNALSREKHFSKIENLTTTPDCSLTDTRGTTHPCLVKAADDAGNWTIVTLEGELQTFSKDQVAENGR